MKSGNSDEKLYIYIYPVGKVVTIVGLFLIVLFRVMNNVNH